MLIVLCDLVNKYQDVFIDKAFKALCKSLWIRTPAKGKWYKALLSCINVF